MRRTIGPFPEFRNLPVIDPRNELDVKERRDFLADTLRAAGAKCNGECRVTEKTPNAVRDPGWERDLTKFMARPIPPFKLETLRAEVDANNEICCWVFEE